MLIVHLVPVEGGRVVESEVFVVLSGKGEVSGLFSDLVGLRLHLALSRVGQLLAQSSSCAQSFRRLKHLAVELGQSHFS